MKRKSQLAVMAAPILAVVVIGSFLLLRLHGQQVAVPITRHLPAASSCGREHKSGRYFGIAPGDNWETKLSRFDSAGLKPSLVEFYVRFGSPFDYVRYCQVTRTGAIPFIQLNPFNESLTAIASGKYDSQITSDARSIRVFDHSVVLSFAPEMNGSSYSWGATKTKPATYIAAWRHIHDVFASEHVTKVIWLWDVGRCCTPPHQWWPGTRYVDWVGMDGYLRPTQTFQYIFGKVIAGVRSFTSKPILIAETAVAPAAQWDAQIRNLFAGVRRDRLLGLVWFNINAERQWRIDNNPAALAAVKKEAIK